MEYEDICKEYEALLHKGQLDNNEFWRLQDLGATIKYHDIRKALNDGKEQEAADLIRFAGNWGKWRSANYLDVFFCWFKDEEILFKLIIDVYTNDGYNFPRWIIIQARKLARKIPEAERLNGLPDGEYITVYRASSATPEKARNEISWTTDRNTAIWFAHRLVGSKNFPNPLKVYQGRIARKSVIAYDNSRNEFEVIQHSSVKEIQEVSLTDDEIKAAMEWKAADTKASWDRITGKSA